MIPANAQVQPKAMTVDFAVFQHDHLLCRGRIRIEEHEKCEEFDYFEPASAPTGNVIPAGHVVIRHRFNVPAASLELMAVQFTTHHGTPEVILNAALMMGVHDSEDWESIALGREHTFAFLCHQEFEPDEE